MKPPPGFKWKMKIIWKEIANIYVVDLDNPMELLARKTFYQP